MYREQYESTHDPCFPSMFTGAVNYRQLCIYCVLYFCVWGHCVCVISQHKHPSSGVCVCVVTPGLSQRWYGGSGTRFPGLDYRQHHIPSPGAIHRRGESLKVLKCLHACSKHGLRKKGLDKPSRVNICVLSLFFFFSLERAPVSIQNLLLMTGSKRQDSYWW